jgi:choline-sulfatase
MKSQNMIVILSDEHNPKITKCYGHDLIQTPNLDRLAKEGTRFTSAYTNCPICVPARASLATGRYVHDVQCWDNAIAYEGNPLSWGHRLMETGHQVTSIGKLHYTRSNPKVNGFDEEILPMHLVEGLGDLLGLIRDELPRRAGALNLGPESGRGESAYTKYDRDITAAACKWLAEKAANKPDKPWVLYVGLVAPHFPLIAPAEFYDMYADLDLPWPKLYGTSERPHHPFLDAMRACMVFDDGFTDDDMVRRAITAYFGLVSFLDNNIGLILNAVRDLGLMGDTRIIYSSDHGDNLGARGFWGKSTMYEESAGIPLIFAGADVPQNAVCDTPVTLVDLFPTIMEGVGELPHAEDRDLPGESLFAIANGAKRKANILSEYHAAGAATGSYMTRVGKYKFMYYVGMPPMLFDLEADPEELLDLAADPLYKEVLQQCELELRKLVDPEAADRAAKLAQTEKIVANGGKEAILERGGFRFSPPPGVKPSRYK